MKVNINWDKFDSEKYKPLYHEKIPDYKQGTLAHDDYWDQQDDYCLNGFKPNPHMPKLTGKHYFYLNMCRIRLLPPGKKRKITASPFYRELDRRLFNEIEDARHYSHGLIIGKPRRVGLSYVGTAAIAQELTMYKENMLGVAAGQEDKAQDFYDKVKKMMQDIRPEYRSGVLTQNDEEFKLGYNVYENKQNIPKGLLSTMQIKTMYAKPTGFEGKEFSMAIFEEAGLFQDLIAAYKSAEPCFKEGSIYYGTPIIYGTGGDIEKDSKGYMQMWNAPREAYNLKKVLVLATDYYPGDGIPDKDTGKKVSFFDFRTGRTDSKQALKFIMKERKDKEGTEGYVKHIQSYPVQESEIFIKSTGGYLNRQKLNAQVQNLPNCPYLIQVGRLEWHTKDDTTLKLVAKAKNLKEIDKIHFKRKSTVKFVEDEKFGNFTKIMDPIQNHNLDYCPDIAGCDSYDEDIQNNSKISDGATIIYRTFYSTKQPHDLPVGFILDRGSSDQDDIFYSTNVRAAVMYGYELLVEYTKVSIINYFKDVEADYKHLKQRPDLQGYNSNATNQYGFKMPNQHAFKLILRLLKREVENNYNQIWFKEILLHLINFGESNSDLGSAYGMVLVSKLDLFEEQTDGIDEDRNDGSALLDFDTFVYENGTLINKSYREIYNEKEGVENIQLFDPEYDLDEEDKEIVNKEEIIQKKRIKQERKTILETYNNDVMAFAIKDFHDEIKKNK